MPETQIFNQHKTETLTISQVVLVGIPGFGFPTDGLAGSRLTKAQKTLKKKNYLSTER
jgi:hypothetical protein